MTYAKRVRPNALFIYLQLTKEYQNQDYVTISNKEIKKMTGIAENKLNPFIDELKEVGLIEELDNDEYICNRYDRIFILNSDIWNCKGGFLEVPKRLLDMKEIEVSGEKIKIKPPHKILLILHMILAENKGYSFAGREYFAETLGIKELKTVTTQNKTLEQAGLIKIDSNSFYSVVDKKPKTNNKYYMADWLKPVKYEREEVSFSAETTSLLKKLNKGIMSKTLYMTKINEDLTNEVFTFYENGFTCLVYGKALIFILVYVQINIIVFCGIIKL